MTTQAQIEANRLNAQKSTGPRTPEGKATAAQNALKHGLLAREGAIRGEDEQEFADHRERLLEQLLPRSPLEEILADRIVDLTWRLRRVAQDQDEAFAALYDRQTAAAEEAREPAEGGAILGRMILEDYGREAVLERLLRYERRIESSLYRTLNELRRVHDQGCKADLEEADTLQRWREEDWSARKAKAFAVGRPAAPPAWPPGEKMCQTNPIAQEVASVKSEGSSSEPALETSHFTLATSPACQTNPIWPEPGEGQVLWGQEVRNNWSQDVLGKTNPISGEAPGLKCQVPSEESQASSFPTSHLTVETPNSAPAWAEEVGRGRPTYDEPPAGTATRDETCETNPIWPDPKESQVPCGKEVRTNSPENRGGKTNPIPAGGPTDAAFATDRSCGTNPKGSGRLSAVGSQLGAFCTNKANGVEVQMCQTNPIPPTNLGPGAAEESQDLGRGRWNFDPVQH